MGNCLIPWMQRELRIHAAPSCYEMVFACADGSFRSIGLVFVGGSELEVNLLFVHAVLEELASFIVKALQFRFASTVYEAFDDLLVAIEEGGRFAIPDWLE